MKHWESPINPYLAFPELHARLVMTMLQPILAVFRPNPNNSQSMSKKGAKPSVQDLNWRP